MVQYIDLLSSRSAICGRAILPHGMHCASVVEYGAPEVDSMFLFFLFLSSPSMLTFVHWKPLRTMDTQILEKKKTSGYYTIISEAVTPCGCRVGRCLGR